MCLVARAGTGVQQQQLFVQWDVWLSFTISLPMLIVACRLMTSGVKGVSLLGSRVFKFCNKPKDDTIKFEDHLDSIRTARKGGPIRPIANLFAQTTFFAHLVRMHCGDHCSSRTWRSVSDEVRSAM